MHIRRGCLVLWTTRLEYIALAARPVFAASISLDTPNLPSSSPTLLRRHGRVHHCFVYLHATDRDTGRAREQRKFQQHVQLHHCMNDSLGTRCSCEHVNSRVYHHTHVCRLYPPMRLQDPENHKAPLRLHPDTTSFVSPPHRPYFFVPGHALSFAHYSS